MKRNSWLVKRERRDTLHEVRFTFFPLLSQRRRLIPDQPVEAQHMDDLLKIIKIDRLADIAVGAEFIAFDHILLLGGRGKNDNRKQPGQLIAANLSQDLQAVYLRKF